MFKIPKKNKFWLINICKKIKKIIFVQKKSFLSILFNKKPPNNTFRINYIMAKNMVCCQIPCSFLITIIKMP